MKIEYKFNHNVGRVGQFNPTRQIHCNFKHIKSGSMKIVEPDLLACGLQMNENGELEDIPSKTKRKR